MSANLKKILKKNEFIMYLYDWIREFYWKNCISDKKLIKDRFKERLGRKVELENPIKFNDKLQWLKLNWYDPLATRCSDKYKVRKYVKEKIGEKYLNELYEVYESVAEINFTKLPRSFVLKATHGSGMNIICKDKRKINWDEEFKIMRRWLRRTYGLSKVEWVYRDIKPRIICEKYLEGENGKSPKDYKIFCFNGEPKFIEVDFDRHTSHKRNLYDRKWNFIDAEIIYPNKPNKKISKPINFDEMLRVSKILSEDFPHVRVDLYNIFGKIFFGELTFFHESGMGKFKPEEFEVEVGKWLELPKS
ncbi:MAG: ATP-grasp fold amidoligase family protein [archaeon]